MTTLFMGYPREWEMPSPQDIRKAALSLDGVTEVDHFGRPSFRTKKRIFAVIRPDGLYLHLPDERKEFLFEADPKTFAKFMWGKRSNVIVDLKRIGKRELAALIREAWESVKPMDKRLGAKRAKVATRTSHRT